MAEACWNCKKLVTSAEEASVPMVLKLGAAATMMLFTQSLFYPSHICRRCRFSTILIGMLSLLMFGTLAGYAIYAWATK